MSRILVISFTDLASDPRVDRQIGVLGTRHEIVAAGLAPPEHAVSEFVELLIPRRTVLGNVSAGLRLLARRYDDAYWKHPGHVAALKRLRTIHADVIVANDLTALPIAVRLGPPVVFDAHEYAPGQFADVTWWRVLVAPYLDRLSRIYIPQAVSMTTVAYGIANAYYSDTGVRPTVVTNAPPRAELSPTPVHEPIRILHHGSAQRRRGLEEMIRLGELLDERFTLDFVLVEGSSGYRDNLIHRAEGNASVRFPPPWPMREIVTEANNYDIGLFLLPPVSLHRRYALPNKFFEFIQARLAVAIGPSPEMASLVSRYGFGLVADDFSPESLAAEINLLDVSAIETFKRASHFAADKLCMEANAEILLSTVEDALAQKRYSRSLKASS
jgi:hypothetical protein